MISTMIIEIDNLVIYLVPIIKFLDKKMKNLFCLIFAAIEATVSSCTGKQASAPPSNDTILVSDTIQFHPVRLNKEDGSILPWFSSDKGRSYDTVLMLVWNFWKNMEADSNGLKYYMNHQVWKPEHDMRGLGGDQINMALSSWGLLYAYTGYPEIIENMRYLADTYLERSLSGPDDEWPNIPYPYNTVIHSGKYDGDMKNGKDITQPDKAGNFGYELINLYKITGDRKYLDAAMKIAAALAEHIQKGDSLKSPLPFRVNAKTGEAGLLFDNNGSGKRVEPALYTSDWTCTMKMFQELAKLDPRGESTYEKSFGTILEWMKEYPLKMNKWGPFFEDVPGWSNTQTNAISFAIYILEHRDLFPDWKADVKGIFDWTYKELENHDYEKYKVTVMNEQTVYRVPGNSHSSRQASAELIYTALSGDTTYKTNAIRTLNWATYTVAADGRNRYIHDDIWLTDGYGDYVRHYLRAMAAMPELAPSEKNCLLGSSSVVKSVKYQPGLIEYLTWDENSNEILHLTAKPKTVTVNGKPIVVNADLSKEGWSWQPLQGGGILRVFHTAGNSVKIII
jgi:hypothetical protein